MANRWFEVDKEGLGKLIEKQNKGKLIAELLQNALDEDVTRVAITLKPVPGSPTTEIIVEDDSPDGFKDLRHAYTLFAESYKKSNPEKRGRFNFGEKLVLALCRSATITTTTGTVEFAEDGKRAIRPRIKRERGSQFRAIIRMTRREHDEVITFLDSVLIPSNVEVTVNGARLQSRTPLHTFDASLETEVADEEQILRKRTRRTRVEIYETKVGESAWLCEMGIPVVETGDKWNLNICQRVPLNLDRDNVKPAYLKRVRTLVYNEMHDRVSNEEVNNTWVQEATSHSECSAPAINSFLDKRFGRDRASFDPSDPEAGKKIQARGGTVITGSMLNKQQWQKAKEAEAIVPAGRICPTSKPYSDDPEASPEDLLPRDQWTEDVRNIASYAEFLARELMGVEIEVRVTRVPNNFLACYGHRELTFNLQKLGHRWFNKGLTEEVDMLIIHEFGHEYSTDHLSSDYYDALCKLGARLKRLALDMPEKFQQFELPKKRGSIPAPELSSYKVATIPDHTKRFIEQHPELYS